MPVNKLDHIALILDGNKRWSKKNNVSLKYAYREGLNNINKILSYVFEYNLKYITLFTLSSENINRSSINNIFEVIYSDFSNFFDKIIEENLIKIKVIGSRRNLPKKIIELINHCEKETKNNNSLNLNLAFNYGFKDELKNALIKYSKNHENININNNNEINDLFYLGNDPDPDLLIRTGGEKRLSNFIMYNLTYTELFFTDSLWPDFSKYELLQIINKYNKIQRKYGL